MATLRPNSNSNKRRKTLDEATKEKIARENHCAIERRRRIKMASYFSELCDTVPSCGRLSKKPDKLTVLRMATQHVLEMRTQCNEFLSRSQLQELFHQALGGGFVIVLDRNTGKILFSSDSNNAFAHCNTERNVIGSTIYDNIAEDDIEHVRRRLCYNVDGPKKYEIKSGALKPLEISKDDGRLIERTMFTCRWRTGMNPDLFTYMQFSGYFKDAKKVALTLEDNKIDEEEDDDDAKRVATIFCGMGSKLVEFDPPSIDPTSINNNSNNIYMKHDLSGIITYVDENAADLFGYERCDMLQCSISKFCIEQDAERLQSVMRYTMRYNEDQLLQCVTFKRSNGQLIFMDCYFTSLRNPYNDEFIFLIGTYCLSHESPLALGTDTATAQLNPSLQQWHMNNYTLENTVTAANTCNNFILPPTFFYPQADAMNFDANGSYYQSAQTMCTTGEAQMEANDDFQATVCFDPSITSTTHNVCTQADQFQHIFDSSFQSNQISYFSQYGHQQYINDSEDIGDETNFDFAHQ